VVPEEPYTKLVLATNQHSNSNQQKQHQTNHKGQGYLAHNVPTIDKYMSTSSKQ
jgi:hypothetical protein